MTAQAIDPAFSPLALRPMPQLAQDLRDRRDAIVRAWSELVTTHLPDADPLTMGQVRDSIPVVLDKIAEALEHPSLEATRTLSQISQGHGIARSQVRFAIDEFITEYRLLRYVVLDQIADGGRRSLDLEQTQAVLGGVELAMQSGIISYVQQQTDCLRDVAESESRYVSFLSHDVRNNLNSANLMIELLAGRLTELPGLEEEARDVLHLKRSIRQTVEGMERVLQAERVRRQAHTELAAPIALQRLAEEVIQQHQRDASQKGLTISIEIPDDARAHGDASVLGLALQNLLGNAIKYSRQGTITIGAERVDTRWRLFVRDQGEGISPQRLQQLFQAFSRGETHGQAGVGLGLYIASHAVRTLGSELKVESELGKGSTFYMDLTAAPPV